MTTLVLDILHHEPIELALDAPRFVLWRRGTEVRMSLDELHVARVRRALARHGVRTAIVSGELPTAPTAVRAVGTALVPARLRPTELDVIEVRVVPLGEATARALWRPVRSWPVGARRRSRCRALLRGSDVLLEVRRTAWCARETIRANRRTLRPVLFDVAATARPMRIHASERALTQWIEG